MNIASVLKPLNVACMTTAAIKLPVRWYTVPITRARKNRPIGAGH